MVYKSFRIVCTVRVILLGVMIFLFFYLLNETSLYATVLIVSGVIIYQVYSLVRYVERTNINLTRFLQSIKYADFSQSFTLQGFGTSFNELNAAFTDVMEEFRKARSAKEEHYRYLQTIVQHVGIGLITFQPNGEVQLINTAAKRLLKVNQLKNIRSLESLSKTLVDALFLMKPGDKSLVRIEVGGEALQLAIYATEFKLLDQKYTLVSLQNIHYELEEKEMEAWQNLIRVLTHEIMNSITPISSLASTANDLLGNTVDLEAIDDVRGAVQTIQKRSHGLLHFVESYRKLTRIPKPDFQIFSIAELFKRIEQLMGMQLAEKQIDFNIMVEPETLELTADPELIEQVLINLLMNAIQAVENETAKRISIQGLLDDRGRTIIQVVDNGPGIIKQVQEKIFIPFFTTKKNGTGIGLSLSRQIMRLHRGAISVRSKPYAETVFTLLFN